MEAPVTSPLTNPVNAPVLTLPECDGKRIAIEFPIAGETRVLCGVGRWIMDGVLGDALQIPIEGDGAPEILLSQASWRGKATRDFKYGCEVYIRLG